MEPVRAGCPEVLLQTTESPTSGNQEPETFDLIIAELLKALMPMPQKDSLPDQRAEAKGEGDAAAPQISASILIPALNEAIISSLPDQQGKAKGEGDAAAPQISASILIPVLNEAPVLSMPKALISMPQVESLPDQQGEAKGQDDAIPTQTSANLLIPALNAATVSAVKDTNRNTLPEALPLSVEQGDKVKTALPERTPVQHKALQGKDDAAITDVLTTLFKAGGNDSEGKAPFLEALKPRPEEQRAPEPKDLTAPDDQDPSGTNEKDVTSMERAQKIAEDMAFMESTVKGNLREGGETVTMPGKDQAPDPALAVISGRTEPLSGAAGPADAMPAVRFQPASGTAHVEGHKFVITRHDGTSIEISLQPEGLGRLDIELVLDKGVVHAQIQASHAVGKELVEQNITEIMNTLAQEGIAIGGFSVSLKQGRDTGSEGMKQGYHKGNKDHASGREPASVAHNGNQGMISIFV